MAEYTDTNNSRRLLYVVNVDWYFLLHWVDRALAAQDAGFDVCIATNISSAANEQKLSDYGFKVYHVPFTRNSMNPLRDIYSFLYLWNAIVNVHPAIVHCVTIKPVVYGGLLSRIRVIPCVASIVGLGSVFIDKSASSRTVWWLLSRAMMIAMKTDRSLVTFENSHDRDVLVQRSGIELDRTVILPGAGVDLDRFKFIPETINGTFRIFFASRLLRSKGLEILVDATEHLNTAGIPTELHVAGIQDLDARDPIPLSTIDTWVSQGKLVWHGNMQDVEKMIASSNVVCLPTTYGEGIPRILIEAAACGRAVVSTFVPGCREFVNNDVDGLLVAPDDVDALTMALKRLVADPATRERMGLAGRSKVERFYSNAVVTEHTLECYFRVLDGLSK